MTVKLNRADKLVCFLDGYSSVFDISGNRFTTDEDDNEPSGFQKDYLALCGDWINIGNDMRKAINQEKSVNKGLYGG